jgi:hypothetical protein
MKSIAARPTHVSRCFHQIDHDATSGVKLRIAIPCETNRKLRRAKPHSPPLQLYAKTLPEQSNQMLQIRLQPLLSDRTTSVVAKMGAHAI